MKELGFKDLVPSMNIESFNAEIDSIKEIVVRYQENLPEGIDEKTDTELETIVKDTNDKVILCDKPISEVFPAITQETESIYVLTRNLFDFLGKTQEKSKSSLNEKFIEYIFDEGAPYPTIESILTNIEGFLKELTLLVCKNDNRKKVEGLMLEKLINIEDHIKDEKPLVDSNIPYFKSIAHTLRIYRNKKIHDDSSLKYYISQVKKGAALINREIIRDSVACFVMMVVYYRSDDIYAIIDSQNDVLNNNLQEIKEYEKELKREQLSILNKIYGINGVNEIGLKSISSVLLKPYGHDHRNIDNVSCALLAGESGTGKSTCLAEMVYNNILRWENDNNSPLPIKIEMQYFTEEYKNNFFNFVVSQIKNTINLESGEKIAEEIRADVVHNFLRSRFVKGSAILYVDGLNELNPSLGEVRFDAIKGLVKLSEQYGNCKTIVTSRIKDMGLDEEDGESIYGDLVSNGSIGSFLRFDLQPFDESQIEEQIGNYLKAISGSQVDKRRVRIIADKIAKNKIKDLAKNPLQLIHIIKFFVENGNNNSLSVSNRSQLLLSLTKHIVKVKFNNPGVDTPKKINEVIINVLLALADEQYKRKNNRGFSVEEIKQLCDNIISEASLDRKWDVERMLDTAVTFGILEKKDELYDFRHDSWREHFQAYNIVRRLLDIQKKGDTPQDILNHIAKDTSEFTDNIVTDFFRHVFEIMEAKLLVDRRIKLNMFLETCKKREKDIADEIKKAENDEEYQKFKIGEYEYSRLSKLQERERHIETLKTELAQKSTEITDRENQYLLETANDRRFMNQLASMLLKYKNGMKILAYATATMESFELDNTDTENPLPKILVEREIMQKASSYKDDHPFGITLDIKLKLKQHIDEELKPLFDNVAVSGNEKLYAEIFDLYWLNIWLNIWPNYKEEVEHHRILFVLPSVMIAKSENQLALFNQFFVAYQKLCFLNKIELAQRIERMMMRLIARMDDGDVIDVITSMLSQEGGEHGASAEYAMKRRIGAKALLGLKDADLMFKILNDRPELKSYKFNTTIHVQTIENLFEKFDDARMQEFIVGNHYGDNYKEGLIETLPQGDMEHLKALRFVLFHYDLLSNEVKKTLIDYLVSDQGQEIVSSHTELMDILKLEEVPELIKNEYDLTDYDNDSSTDLFKTEIVNYTVLQKGEDDNKLKFTIAIPCPKDEDLQPSGIEILVGAENANVKIKSGDFVLTKQEREKHKMLLIEWINKLQQDVPSEGKLRFLKDNKVMPQYFERLRDMIWLNHPKFYHSSICDKLIEECNDYDDFSDMFFFFKEKSRLGLFLDKFYRKCMRGDSSHNWDIGRIEVCEILGVGQTQVRLFSPLRSGICEMYKDGVFKESIFKRGVISIDYQELPNETGFVILEKNEMLSSIYMNILNPDNMRLFGCVNGFFKHNQEGDVIQTIDLRQAKECRPVVFQLDQTNDLQLVDNDTVSFFPSIKTDKDKVTYIAKQVRKQNEVI